MFSSIIGDMAVTDPVATFNVNISNHGDFTDIDNQIAGQWLSGLTVTAAATLWSTVCLTCQTLTDVPKFFRPTRPLVSNCMHVSNSIKNSSFSLY